jgi:hypothetical protein
MSQLQSWSQWSALWINWMSKGYFYQDSYLDQIARDDALGGSRIPSGVDVKVSCDSNTTVQIVFPAGTSVNVIEQTGSIRGGWMFSTPSGGKLRMFKLAGFGTPQQTKDGNTSIDITPFVLRRT